jgi:hypothetical protein
MFVVDSSIIISKSLKYLFFQMLTCLTKCLPKFDLEHLDTAKYLDVQHDLIVGQFE